MDGARRSADSRGDPSCERGLAGPGKTTYGDQIKLCWLKKGAGGLKHSSRRGNGLSRLRRLEIGHLGADRRTQAEEKRQRRETFELRSRLVKLRQIMVHHRVGLAMETAGPKIHQQEGEIVEDVARRQAFVE